MSTRRIVFGVAGSALSLLNLGARHAARTAAEPETVMVTYHAKAGAEDELARVIKEHWAAATRLNLVAREPHVLVRSAEPGQRVDYMEIFTWRDASIPDSAPAPIRAAWDKMNSLVEPRAGHAGLEFVQVKLVE